MIVDVIVIIMIFSNAITIISDVLSFSDSPIKMFPLTTFSLQFDFKFNVKYMFMFEPRSVPL